MKAWMHTAHTGHVCTCIYSRARTGSPSSESSPHTAWWAGRALTSPWINEQGASLFLNYQPQHLHSASSRLPFIRLSSCQGIAQCVYKRSQGDAEHFKGWQTLFQKYGLAFGQRLKPGEPEVIKDSQSWRRIAACKSICLLPHSLTSGSKYHYLPSQQ